MSTYPRSSASGSFKERGARDQRPSILSIFFGDRRTYGVVLGRFFCDSIWYFYIFWLPDYLSRIRHFSIHDIGTTTWIPFVAAAIGNLVGGALSGKLLCHGLSACHSRLLVMAGSAIAMTAGVSVWFCDSAMGSIAVVSFVVFAYSCWATNILTLPSDLFPSGAVATVVGFSGMAGGLGGVLTTLMAGWMIDHTSYLSVFIVLGLLPLAASACSFLSWQNSQVHYPEQA